MLTSRTAKRPKHPSKYNTRLLQGRLVVCAPWASPELKRQWLCKFWTRTDTGNVSSAFLPHRPLFEEFSTDLCDDSPIVFPTVLRCRWDAELGFSGPKTPCFGSDWPGCPKNIKPTSQPRQGIVIESNCRSIWRFGLKICCGAWMRVRCRAWSLVWKNRVSVVAKLASDQKLNRPPSLPRAHHQKWAQILMTISLKIALSCLDVCGLRSLASQVPNRHVSAASSGWLTVSIWKLNPHPSLPRAS